MNLFTNPINLLLANLYILAIFASLSSLGFLFLFWAKGSKKQSVRYFFYIPANKSKTNTLQLGGLPLVMVIIGMIAWLAHQPATSIQEKSILLFSLILYSGVLCYGYLDDRFEIRPIFKLAGQIIIALSYSLASSQILYPSNSSYAFLFNFILIMTTINGTNLLDGMDTMSFKIFLGTLIYFAVLSSITFSDTSTFLTYSLLAILLPFYILNRPPAKVYLGEIGVGAIAISAVVLSNLAFLTLTQTEQPLKASTYSILPLIIPGMELAVSFLRRFLNKRSPFKGDKLHIHHILHSHYKMSPNKIITYYFLSQISLCFFGFFMIQKIGSVIGVVITTLTLCLGLLQFGKKHWVTKDLIPINLLSFFRLSLKSRVKIISGSALNDFQVHVITEKYPPLLIDPHHKKDEAPELDLRHG